MQLGIDLGTSSVKAVVTDASGSSETATQEVVAEATVPLAISRPGPRMSEQTPEHWWLALEGVMGQLRPHLPRVDAIGLSGQMHGAVLLGEGDEVLRPAILWNDGRADAECEWLEEHTEVLSRTGNRAMPGFTAPKLIWVRRHEPALFAATRKVLLPKDWLRHRLTGEFASEMSDASGTLWLDVSKRAWSDEMLAATELGATHMPRLVEGSEVSGTLRPALARAWGMREVPVVGGAGDQAAGGVGVGAIVPGASFVSLGTSGVYFAPDTIYRPNPDGGVHAFCHALPGLWHQMSVILSAASALTWATALTHADSEAALIAEIEANGVEPGALFFLPYLSGERTPHNDANALGAFVGLSHETDRAQLGQAVLEGVAFALADGQRALTDAGANLGEVSVIGGGAQSLFWGKTLAAALGRPLTYRRDAAVGPALGAARLAAIATTDRDAKDICPPAPIEAVVEPDSEAVDRAKERLEVFRNLYQDLKPRFPTLHDA